MTVDWKAQLARVESLGEQQSLQTEPNATDSSESDLTSFNETRKRFSQARREQNVARQQVIPEADVEIDELDEIGRDLKRALYGKIATGLDAFGQFEASQDFWDLHNDNLGSAKPPEFGELPSARFIKQTAIEEGSDIAASVGLALIPVVGPPLFVADLVIGMYGESRKNIVDETGEDQPFVAAAPAAINSAFEGLVPVRMLRKMGLGKVFGDTLKEVSSSKGFKKVVEEALGLVKTGVLEGSTEVAQNLVNEATIRVITDKKFLAGLTAEDKNELWGDFWAGLSAGSSVHAVVSGVSAVQAKAKLKDVEDTMARDKAILESLETDEPVKPRVKVDADGTIIKPRVRATLAGVPIEEHPDADPDETVSLDDLLEDPIIAEQDQRIRDHVDALPDDEKETAINSLRTKIGEAEALLETYKGLTSDKPEESIDDLFATEGNNNMSLRYSLEEDPSITRAMASDGLKFLTKSSEQDGETIVTSSDAPLAANIEPYQLIANPESVVEEDFQMAEQLQAFLAENGLDFNPHTGQKMRLLVKVSDSHATLKGSFAVIDESTMQVRLTRHPASAIINSDREKVYMESTGIHEIGHLIATKVLANATAGQRARLYNEWKSALDSTKNRHAYYERFAPSYEGFGSVDVPVQTTDGRGVGESNYATSLQEFLAEQFMISMSKKSTGTLKKDHPSLFNGTKKAYFSFWKSFKKRVKVVGDEDVSSKTFGNFIETIGISNEIRELKAQEAQLVRDEKAAKENKDLKPDMDSDFDKLNKQQVTNSNIDNFDHTSDAGKVANFLDTLGMKKQADEVRKVVRINMGFLGNSIRGAASRKMLTPLQIAEQANKKGFTLPTKYMELIQSFQVTKMTIIQKADERLNNLKSLGPDGLTRVSRALYLISTRSDEVKRRLTEAELSSVFSQLKMSEQEIAEWRDTDLFMRDMIDNIEGAMMYDAAKIYIADRSQAKAFRDEYVEATTKAERESLIEQYTGEPIVNLDANNERLVNPMFEAAESVRKNVDAMRTRNYFPRSRLGEYAVKVVSTRKGATFEGVVAKGEKETIAFYAFDTEAEQAAFLETLAPDMGNGIKAQGYKMDSVVFAAMGMPSGMIDQIKRNVDGLTKRQAEQLGDIALQRSPGRKFLRHLTRRRGVKGYSEDALRVFANYASSASNHVARAEWASDLTDTIGEMEQFIQDIPGDTTSVNDLNVMKDYFAEHLDYVMRPDNDWARLRAMGFVYYLGFNPKSAAVNIMQTPMVLYPSLAAHTSDKNAVKRIGGAMFDAARYMRGGRKLEPDVLNTIQHMIEAGLIDESMVSELAGIAEGNSLRRLVPGMDIKSSFDKFSSAAGYMFRVGEKYNRYITAIAAHRVAKDNGLEGEAITKFVRDMIQGSQFEYAKWNRASFMRGKKSVVFLFWQYMQHANYLLFGGKGSKTATRMWLMALMVAGIEGLPFAEFIFDVVDFGGTKIKKVLGEDQPRMSIRNELRDMILQIHDRPDDILKGMSFRFGLGPLHAASLLGVPIPDVSTRGSLSYGDPVAWFDGFKDPTISDSTKAIAKTVAAVAGPVGGMGLGIIDALYSKDPDNWKRWEKTLPIFMRNASTGVRWAAQDGETDFSKAKILTFTTPEERAEMTLKALGFQPTRVDQTRQQIRAAQVPVLLTQLRREELIRQLDYANLTDNSEGFADVRKAIQSFNAELDNSEGLSVYKISSKTIIKSLRARQEGRALKEAGLLQGRKGVNLQREVERLYPVDK